ncbi:MAG: hypothetical protein WAM13_19320 [Candidatus Sulfotelmatobacter sp.]
MVDRHIKVRLLVDLSQYDRQLVKGTEGITASSGGFWSSASDRFVAVRFPNIGTFDILWQSLKITDREFLAECKMREKAKLKALETATNVVCSRGPRGGFQCVSYEYIDAKGVLCHESIGDREAYKKLADFFRTHGIEIRDEISM